MDETLANPFQNPPAKRLSILLAEDTAANRKVVERVLTSRGHDVTSAVNGHEAFDLFRSRRFDVVLMDIQMPQMDGIQTTVAIRAWESQTDCKRHIPIIAMTAHAMASDRQRCTEAGMDDYISKPISIRNLVAMVEKYVSLSDQSPWTASEGNGDTKDSGSSSPIIIWNPDAALQRLGGDKSLLCDLIGFYLEDRQELLRAIEQSFAERDSQALEQAAHKLKGIVSNFDASSCQDLAASIEAAASNGQLDSLGDSIEELKQKSTRLKTELQSYRDNQPS